MTIFLILFSIYLFGAYAMFVYSGYKGWPFDGAVLFFCTIWPPILFAEGIVFLYEKVSKLTFIQFLSPYRLGQRLKKRQQEKFFAKAQVKKDLKTMFQ